MKISNLSKDLIIKQCLACIKYYENYRKQKQENKIASWHEHIKNSKKFKSKITFGLISPHLSEKEKTKEYALNEMGSYSRFDYYMYDTPLKEERISIDLLNVVKQLTNENITLSKEESLIVFHNWEIE